MTLIYTYYIQDAKYSMKIDAPAFMYAWVIIPAYGEHYCSNYTLGEKYFCLYREKYVFYT